MKRLIWLWLLVSASAWAVDAKPTRFDFRGIGVAQVVQLIYAEALIEPYVIDPEVLADTRQVSFRFDAGKGDVHAFVAAFLDSVGLIVAKRGGVDYVTKKPVTEKPPPDADVLVYRPRYRDGSYLVDILGPLLKGGFTAKKTMAAAPGDKLPQSAVAPGSAAAIIDHKADTLVFTGTPAEVERLNRLLAQVDVPTGDVMVRAVLYEVQTDKSDGSAFSLALNLLGGRLTAGLGTAAATGNFLQLKNQTIDAVASSLSTDSRFVAKSTPTLRVVSGGTGRFTVGEDVPVLGAVTYTGVGGAAVQSVEYRSSGLIFDLQPVLHESDIDLTVMQQVSNFVTTDTGVNGSPTLIKRELKTSLSLADGELVVIGGLADSKDTSTRDGLSFIPEFLHSRTSDKQQTEILLVLQVTRI